MSGKESAPDDSVAMALCELLYPTSPPRWEAAVRRAAQLLAPAWARGELGRSPECALETLSLLLYATAARRQGTADDEVPVDELLAFLDGERDINDEPISAKAVIREGLAAAGHTRFGDEIGWLHFRLTRRDGPPEDVPLALGGGAPDPSALRYGIAWAGDALHALEADADLPAVPVPPPLALRIDGRVRVIDWHGITYRAATITCQECGATRDGTLTTDGADVVYTCSHGHPTRDPNLMTATRVRGAIDRQANGQRRLVGDLLVPSPDMPASTDLRPQACKTRFP